MSDDPTEAEHRRQRLTTQRKDMADQVWLEKQRAEMVAPLVVHWLVCARCWLASEDIVPAPQNWFLGQPATVQMTEDGKGVYVTPHKASCSQLAAEIARRSEAAPTE